MPSTQVEPETEQPPRDHWANWNENRGYHRPHPLVAVEEERRPGEREPLAVPVWNWREPWNPKCKCLRIDVASLAHRTGYDGPEMRHFLQDVGEKTLTAMRCVFFCRPKGCSKGDSCTYCHVHPKGRLEPDESCIVPTVPTWRNHWAAGRKLTQWEREERRNREGERNNERRLLWRELVLAARQDAQGCMEYGEPVGNIHIAIWGVHKLSLQIRACQKYHAELFDIPPMCIGTWLGVDSLSRNDLHYPLGDTHGVFTLHKGLAFRLEQMAAKTTAPYLLIFEADARCIEGLRGKLHWISWFIEGHNFVWLGFFTGAHLPWYHEKAQLPGTRPRRIEATRWKKNTRRVTQNTGVFAGST